MVPNSEYSGSRLISYEFGLVSDFYINLPYSSPYYLRLVFKKGDRIMTDVWAARNQGFEYIPYLNRILDRKEVDHLKFTNCVYYFTDGTLIEIT